MTAQLIAPPRYGKRKREAQLGLSATTFLALSIWLGPDRAVFLLTVVAIAAGWFALCRRWPLVTVFTLGLVRGLFSRR